MTTPPARQEDIEAKFVLYRFDTQWAIYDVAANELVAAGDSAEGFDRWETKAFEMLGLVDAAAGSFSLDFLGGDQNGDPMTALSDVDEFAAIMAEARAEADKLRAEAEEVMAKAERAIDNAKAKQAAKVKRVRERQEERREQQAEEAAAQRKAERIAQRKADRKAVDAEERDVVEP